MGSKPFYTLGCGDCFGREGEAQLAAYVEAAGQGVPVHPVWSAARIWSSWLGIQQTLSCSAMRGLR